MKYRDELRKAMKMLGEHSETVFLGQSVEVEGTGMFGTLKDVPSAKKLEMPVCEDFQMGITNGLALDGKIPVSIFPRWNFFLLAANQLINHLDKMPIFSGFKTKVIVRVGIGSERPLHPQSQHVGDFTDAYRLMTSNIQFIRLIEPHQILPAYELAQNRTDGKSTVIVEYGDYYNEK